MPVNIVSEEARRHLAVLVQARGLLTRVKKGQEPRHLRART